jgi:mannosyltransferase
MQLRSKLPPNIRPGIPWLCGLLAFAVFVAGIGGPSLWIDEGHTWRYAQEPLGTMLSTTLGSTNAVEAAYYVVLHFWIGIAGSSEVALRLPSAVAMAIAVWAASRTAEQAAGYRAAAIAGFVMIAMPGMTRYAQEARPYAFAVAAVAVSTLMLFQGLTHKERRWWVGYTASLIVIGYFHLLSMLVVPGQFLAMLLIARQEWRKFAVSMVVAAAAVAPVAVLGFGQRGQISWIPPAQLDYLWNGYAVMTGSLALTACLAVLVVTGRGDRRLTTLGLGAALATPVLLWMLGLLGPFYLGRYLLGAAPGIAILAAGAASNLRPASLLALAAIVVALVPAPTDRFPRSGRAQPGLPGRGSARGDGLFSPGFLRRDVEGRDGVLPEPTTLRAIGDRAFGPPLGRAGVRATGCRARIQDRQDGHIRNGHRHVLGGGIAEVERGRTGADGEGPVPTPRRRRPASPGC